MDGKQRNWVTAVISLGAAYLLLWMVVFFYADILPKLLVVTMGALMVVAVIAPTLVFAFGPASLLARYPATVRPLAQAQSSMLVIWIAGSGLFSVVRGTLPERLSEILWVAILIGGFAPVVMSAFGYGRLGRRLTEAAKQEEREAWRS
jgi:hypothetical protein